MLINPNVKSLGICSSCDATEFSLLLNNYEKFYGLHGDGSFPHSPSKLPFPQIKCRKTTQQDDMTLWNGICLVAVNLWPNWLSFGSHFRLNWLSFAAFKWVKWSFWCTTDPAVSVVALRQMFLITLQIACVTWPYLHEYAIFACIFLCRGVFFAFAPHTVLNQLKESTRKWIEAY